MDDEILELAEEARSIPLSEICALLDIELVKGHWNDGFLYSFFRDENTPSLHVTDDEVWFDFGEGKGGDGIDLVKGKLNCSFMQALHFIIGGIDPAAVRLEQQRREKKPERVPDLTGYFHDQLVRRRAIGISDTAALGQWTQKNWGVLPSQLKSQFHAEFLTTTGGDVGWELWSPHAHSPQPNAASIITGIKIRKYPSREKTSVIGSKWLSLYRRYDGFFWPRSDAPAWLVEGESDTWSLSQHADHVAGLPSGASYWRVEWAQALRPFRHVNLVLDEDDAGNKGAEKILGALEQAKIPARRFHVPGGRMAEAITSGWRPSNG